MIGRGRGGLFDYLIIIIYTLFLNQSETVELNIVESFLIVLNQFSAIYMNEVESGLISRPVSINESHSFIAKEKVKLTIIESFLIVSNEFNAMNTNEIKVPGRFHVQYRPVCASF